MPVLVAFDLLDAAILPSNQISTIHRNVRFVPCVVAGAGTVPCRVRRILCLIPSQLVLKTFIRCFAIFNAMVTCRFGWNAGDEHRSDGQGRQELAENTAGKNCHFGLSFNIAIKRLANWQCKSNCLQTCWIGLIYHGLPKNAYKSILVLAFFTQNIIFGANFKLYWSNLWFFRAMLSGKSPIITGILPEH